MMAGLLMTEITIGFLEFLTLVFLSGVGVASVAGAVLNRVLYDRGDR